MNREKLLSYLIHSKKVSFGILITSQGSTASTKFNIGLSINTSNSPNNSYSQQPSTSAFEQDTLLNDDDILGDDGDLADDDLPF